MMNATDEELQAVIDYCDTLGIRIDKNGAEQQTHLIGKIRRGEIKVQKEDPFEQQYKEHGW